MRVVLFFECRGCGRKWSESEDVPYEDDENLRAWIAEHGRTTVHRCTPLQYGWVAFERAVYSNSAPTE